MRSVYEFSAALAALRFNQMVWALPEIVPHTQDVIPDGLEKAGLTADARWLFARLYVHKRPKHLSLAQKDALAIYKPGACIGLADIYARALEASGKKTKSVLYFMTIPDHARDVRISTCMTAYKGPCIATFFKPKS